MENLQFHLEFTAILNKWSDISFDSEVENGRMLRRRLMMILFEMANWDEMQFNKTGAWACSNCLQGTSDSNQRIPKILAKAKEDFQAKKMPRKKFAKKMAEYESLVDEWVSAEKKTRGPKPKKPTAFKAGKFKSPKEPEVLANPDGIKSPRNRTNKHTLKNRRSALNLGADPYEEADYHAIVQPEDWFLSMLCGIGTLGRWSRFLGNATTAFSTSRIWSHQAMVQGHEEGWQSR